MDRFVARANIMHFEDLLSRETDPGKRRVIEGLLARERQKLELAEREAETSREAGTHPKPREPKA